MYQVNILTSKEFDKVAKSNPRYKHVDDTNLGFADPVAKKAYVRYTAFPELNKYLIDHEFEHLLEETGTDEDDQGIRHKKKGGFANILRTFYNPLNIPGMGPLSNSDKGIFNTDNQSSTQGENQGGQMMPQDISQSFQNQFGTSNSQFGQMGGNAQASQTAPTSLGSQVGGNLFGGGLNGQGSQSPDDIEQLKQRLSGFFSGRIPF